MKTKLATLLLVGLNTCCLICFAQDKPAQDSNVQKLYNQPGDAAKPAADATAAATEPVDTGELLPLVQFEEAPLVDVIKTLARQANLNVVFDPRVTTPGPDGRPLHPPVSIRLENVTAGNVLEAVLNNNNLRLERDPKTKISRITIKDPAAAEPLVTKIYQLKYSYPSNLVAVITPTISGRSKVIPDTRTSQLIVLATEKELIEVDTLVEKLDTITKQVLIEARILETSKNPNSAKGINWENTFAAQKFAFGNGLGPNPGGSPASNPRDPDDPVNPNINNPIVSPIASSLLVDTANGFNPRTAFLDADGVRAVLSWFNQDNETEVLATPRAVTMDNQPAVLSITRALPIFKVSTGGTQTGPTVDITYTNIGTILTVTPRISANNSIALKVVPEVSFVEEAKDIQTVGGLANTANIYAIRKMDTQVLIPSGNTLVMGGLVSDRTAVGKTKVPLLGDLPGLGYAFRSNRKDRQKVNLILFITPTVVTDEDFQPTQSDFMKKKAPADRPENDKGPFTNPILDSAEPHDWTKPVY